MTITLEKENIKKHRGIDCNSDYQIISGEKFQICRSVSELSKQELEIGKVGQVTHGGVIYSMYRDIYTSFAMPKLIPWELVRDLPAYGRKKDEK